jgi:hypothetical protein
MKTYIACFLAVITFAPCIAQEKTSIAFEKTLHDFGTIAEDGGNAEVAFIFKNTGNKPLMIKNVTASCGCTTPIWSKDTIAPGGSGKIVASYNPMYRPGGFNKSISVSSNTAPELTVLLIKGNVTPRVKTVEDFYPQKSGSLRLTTSHFAFGTMKSNLIDTVDIKVYNNGKVPVKILSFGSPSYAVYYIDTVRLKPAIADKKPKKKGMAADTSRGLPYTLMPGKEAIITGILFSEKVNDYGWVFKSFMMKTDDAEEKDKQLHMSATIEPYFPPMTSKDSLNAPRISFPKMVYDFGTINQGEVITTDYEGKTELKILKTKTSCGCAASEPEKKVLKPGEKSRIKVTYNSAGKSGKETKTITVITNDPVNTSVVLNITGHVEVEKHE